MNNSLHLPLKSVGTLFPAVKTKLKSPDMLGKVKLQLHFLEDQIEECRKSGAESRHLQHR